MQGTFEEFAIDFLKADGQPLQMIAKQTDDLMGGGIGMPRCSISF